MGFSIALSHGLEGWLSFVLCDCISSYTVIRTAFWIYSPSTHLSLVFSNINIWWQEWGPLVWRRRWWLTVMISSLTDWAKGVSLYQSKWINVMYKWSHENMLTFLQQALTFQDQFIICWCKADPSESAVFSTRKEILVTCGCWPCQLSHGLNVSLRMMHFSLPLKVKWLHYDFNFFFLTFLNEDKSLKLWPQCTQEIWNYKGIKQYPQVFNLNSFAWSFVFLGKGNWCGSFQYLRLTALYFTDPWSNDHVPFTCLGWAVK